MKYFKTKIRKLNSFVHFICVHSVYFCNKYFIQNGN
jgi:hypothetical protein